MFVLTLKRTATLTVLALVAWSVLARSSGAHGPRSVYHVRPGDTLWTIAASHYGGDPRAAIWEIENANHLEGASIYPGERLLLP